MLFDVAFVHSYGHHLHHLLLRRRRRPRLLPIILHSILPPLPRSKEQNNNMAYKPDQSLYQMNSTTTIDRPVSDRDSLETMYSWGWFLSTHLIRRTRPLWHRSLVRLCTSHINSIIIISCSSGQCPRRINVMIINDSEWHFLKKYLWTFPANRADILSSIKRVSRSDA